MNSTDIRSKIQAAAARFTDEIVAVFGEAFAAVASDLAVKAPGKAKPAAKKMGPAKKKAPARKAPAAKKAAAPKKTGKRIRRSGAQLSSDAQKIVKLLATNKKGLRIRVGCGCPPSGSGWALHHETAERKSRIGVALQVRLRGGSGWATARGYPTGAK